jgi:glutathione S-transferase
MKLYGDLISPFVRMCMVTALEAGLGTRVQLVSAVLKPHEVNAALEKLSPIGKIPILETDHGHPLYDSRVIMEYFCHVAGNKALLPDEGNKHFRVLTLLALAQGMGDAAVSLRYETATRPTQWPDFTARQQARIKACMDELEANWHEALAEVTLGAIATAGVLAYIDIRDLSPDWRHNRPRLAAFTETFAARESMVHTAPRT